MVKKKEEGHGAAYSAPAVDMALDLVEFLAENPGAFGINDLSRRLGLAVNSVYRVLRRLAARGYVELDPASNGYQLSTQFISLGMKLHNRIDLRVRARRHLERLAAETGETCQIHTLQQNRMLVLDSVAPGTDFYLRVTPGSLLCAHANAFGKAVLAFLPAERVQDILAAGMPALTEHTHTSSNALVRELAVTRRSGLSYDREEYSTGIYCVGAPVFDVQGAIVAGLGVTGLASRRTAATDKKLRSLVLDCAAAVSSDMGYTGSQFGDWKNLLKQVKS